MQTVDNKNCYDLLELLEETPGRMIFIEFSSMQELERFRVKLYQLKKKNDDHLIGIGFMEESDKKSLFFKRSLSKLSATITLVAKAEEQKYTFTIIDPEDVEKAKGE